MKSNIQQGIMGILNVIAILLFSVSLSYARKKNNLLKTNNEKMYASARKLNDFSLAKLACYNLVELEGDKSNYNDTMTLLYYFEKNYSASYFLSSSLLTKKPSVFALKINAYSLFSLKNYPEAAIKLSNLLAQEKNKSTACRLAFCQWQMGQYTESMESIQYARALHWDDVNYFGLEINNVNIEVRLDELLSFIEWDINLKREEFDKADQCFKNIVDSEIYNRLKTVRNNK